MLTPVTNTIEKYEFGQMDEDDVEVEERVAETGDTFEAVSFQVLSGGLELDEINISTLQRLGYWESGQARKKVKT